MIELKLCVSDIDFASVINAFAGDKLPAGLTGAAVKLMPQSTKEELACKYINANADKLQTMFTEAAERKGIHLTLSGAQANIIK